MASRRTKKQQLERNIEHYMQEEREIEYAACHDNPYYDEEWAAYENYKAQQEEDLYLPDCDDADDWYGSDWGDDYWDYDDDNQDDDDWDDDDSDDEDWDEENW